MSSVTRSVATGARGKRHNRSGLFTPIIFAVNILIRSLGGTDLQLLGIGPNGHIGFNEPDEAFIPQTHCVQLTDATIDANARFFASRDEVPKQAYTMGIWGIMQARRVVSFGNQSVSGRYSWTTSPSVDTR